MKHKHSDTETWLPIIETGGAYSISSHGRVKSHARQVGGRGVSTRSIKERILSQSYTQGYLQVGLRFGGKLQNYRVHRLVCAAFHGVEPSFKRFGQPTTTVVAHGDGDRSNNHVTNLRWATVEENAADRVLHGTALQGDKHPNRKLDSNKVREMRSRHAAGETFEDLAKEYSVAIGTAYGVINRHTWKSVT